MAISRSTYYDEPVSAPDDTAVVEAIAAKQLNRFTRTVHRLQTAADPQHLGVSGVSPDTVLGNCHLQSH